MWPSSPLYGSAMVGEPYAVPTEKYSSAFYVKEGKLEEAEQIGDLLEWNVIGSIRILSNWYEKTIEIFDRDDKIDVYCVTYLPFWYVLQCIMVPAIQTTSSKTIVNMV